MPGHVALARLEQLKASFGGGAGAAKLDLLRVLEHGRLRSASEVLRLHEILCFLDAYPDDEATLGKVREMLDAFEERPDLRRHRRALTDSGIAGTAIEYPFFWFTARWLEHWWPECLTVDWKHFDKSEDLERLLPLMLPYSETPALDEVSLPVRAWIDRLKGSRETDAAFLVRRFEALHPSPFGQETLYEGLGLQLRLAPGPGTPARTGARYENGPAVFQTRPLERSRPNLRRALQRPPFEVRPVRPEDGARLIHLAREAMVTRARDLDNFIHADRNDVRLFDYGKGLQFACFGLVPERRLMLESMYGMLTLKNGVPIGYALASGLFNSSEVMFNVFDTYRGGEAARIYGHALSMIRWLFGADTFSIDPYQLGHDNAEGRKSGAYWFYYKLGYRPLDAGVRRLVRHELGRFRRDPKARSSSAVLQKLSAEYVFLSTARPRRDVLGLVSLGNIGLRISRYLARRYGKEREHGIRACVRDAARLVGLRSVDSGTAGERLAWERWSPLVLALPGVERWSAGDRYALGRIVRAKGGRRESEFVHLFDAHRPLRRAILRMAEDLDD